LLDQRRLLRGQNKIRPILKAFWGERFHVIRRVREQVCE
jgi:hypothetical protein